MLSLHLPAEPLVEEVLADRHQPIGIAVGHVFREHICSKQGFTAFLHDFVCHEAVDAVGVVQELVRKILERGRQMNPPVFLQFL